MTTTAASGGDVAVSSTSSTSATRTASTRCNLPSTREHPIDARYGFGRRLADRLVIFDDDHRAGEVGRPFHHSGPEPLWVAR